MIGECYGSSGCKTLMIQAVDDDNVDSGDAEDDDDDASAPAVPVTTRVQVGHRQQSVSHRNIIIAN